MTAAVLALAAAVATTIAYLALTAHLDYASVRRRQLDAWAAAAALVCFGVILLGNASVQRAQRETATPVPASSDQDALPVPRMTQVSPDRNPPAQMPAPSSELVAIVTNPDVAVAAPIGGALPGAQPETDRTDRMDKTAPPPPAQGEDAYIGVVPTATRAGATATAALGPRPTSGVQPTSVPPQPTDEPPTDEPPPMPSATPHCGDPALIDIEVANIRTRRRNQGQDMVVEYSLDIRNHSPFPVTLRDMRATVSRLGGGGQEQFASQPLTDVTIEPGAVYPVASRVVLETRPPPVGQVQFCLTYATETCGRYNRSGNTRCQVVEGFWDADELP